MHARCALGLLLNRGQALLSAVWLDGSVIFSEERSLPIPAPAEEVLAELKPRAFNEFIRRYGTEKLMDCLARNEAAGVVYHRSKTDLYGDYDKPDNAEDIIRLLLYGKT